MWCCQRTNPSENFELFLMKPVHCYFKAGKTNFWALPILPINWSIQNMKVFSKTNSSSIGILLDWYVKNIPILDVSFWTFCISAVKFEMTSKNIYFNEMLWTAVHQNWNKWSYIHEDKLFRNVTQAFITLYYVFVYSHFRH